MATSGVVYEVEDLPRRLQKAAVDYSICEHNFEKRQLGLKDSRACMPFSQLTQLSTSDWIAFFVSVSGGDLPWQPFALSLLP